MKAESLENEFKRYCLFEKWIQPKSYRTIKNTVIRACDFVNTSNIKKISEDMIRDFLLHGRETKGWTPKTFRNVWQSLKTYFDWCVKRNYIKSNPVTQIERPKLPSIKPRCISTLDARNILYFCYQHPWGNQFQSVRNRAIIATLLMTGLRLQELINLQYDDLDLLQETIFVRRWKGDKQRVIPIYPKLRPILQEYLTARQQRGIYSWFFFTWIHSSKPLQPRDVQTICKHISKACSVKFTPHMLRHTFARELVDNDFDIMKLKELMGHQQVTTTQRYLSLTQRKIKQSFFDTPMYR